jgi:hypothetical protein
MGRVVRISFFHGMTGRLHSPTCGDNGSVRSGLVWTGSGYKGV